MSRSQPGRLTELWYKWKALRLPWRSRWLIGRDLNGTTFWEQHSHLDPSRPRRIAQYPSTVHYADVSHSPAWMQWLRHTRPEAPSIPEQQYELLRQQNLRQLAAAADQRWAEKPSMLDQPEAQGQIGAVGAQMLPRDPGADMPQTEGEEHQGVMNAVKTEEELEGLAKGEDVDKGRFKGPTRDKRERKPTKEDPWKRSSGEQQPQSWQPMSAQRR